MILLVNPWIHDFSAYDLWMKPLGLLYSGAALESHGYDVKLIDCLNGAVKSQKHYNCAELRSEEISKPCHFSDIPRRFKRYGITPTEFTNQMLSLQEEPQLICVTSMMTYWYPGVFEAIHYLRKIFPSVPIALGGIYATLCAEHARTKSGADYVITGPGEEQILKLAQALKCRLSDAPSPIRRPKSDIPAYHLYNNLRSVAMLTSRGCPFQCTYCASRRLNPGFIQRNPQEVISELDYYVTKLGVQDIAFYDDALLYNRQKHIDVILQGIIDQQLSQKVRFHTPNGLHIRFIDESFARKLYQANFKTIRLGFESVSREADSSHKTSMDELPRALENLYQAGFKKQDVGVYVLLGLPGQTLDEMTQSLEFVRQAGGIIKTAQYAPVPGTPDFTKAAKRHPEIAGEPLLHNKSAYYCRANGIKYADLEALKDKAKQLNN